MVVSVGGGDLGVSSSCSPVVVVAIPVVGCGDDDDE